MKEEIKNFLSLAINYDLVSEEYIRAFIEKFEDIFNNIYIVSKSDIQNKYNKAKIINNLNSIKIETKWLLLLNENEFLSIQFLDKFVENIKNIDENIKIIRLPIVIYSSLEDKIIDILESSPRVFKSNPQSLKTSNNDEIELNEIPLIKIL